MSKAWDILNDKYEIKDEKKRRLFSNVTIETFPLAENENKETKSQEIKNMGNKDEDVCPNCGQIGTRRYLGNCMLSSCSICGYQFCPLCGGEIYDEYCIPCVAHMKKDSGIHAVGMCSECTIKKYEKVVGKYWDEKTDKDINKEFDNDINTEFSAEFKNEMC